ncbi:Uncharacterised protein [Cardiobacterium valvarum]|uniref:Uncharacterized protein n=1 Tax=Cardiobacterium valvarum TaxID=194702 RepID=A0A381E9K6_9GAMM|nr:Uncharacterised protein [Cardiobacterium valvarum]
MIFVILLMSIGVIFLNMLSYILIIIFTKVKILKKIRCKENGVQHYVLYLLMKNLRLNGMVLKIKY